MKKNFLKKKILFVLEKSKKKQIDYLFSKHLKKLQIHVVYKMLKRPENYRLIVLWNLKKIIKKIPKINNVIVIHSSDLPKGRGWAPLYYALANNNLKHTISAFLVSKHADRGDIIAKAKFSISPLHTVETLRKVDAEICIMMIGLILKHFRGRLISGSKQKGKPTYFARRYPADSKININKALVKIIPHLRGCGNEYPAFFNWRGYKFQLFLKAKSKPKFPTDLKIKFFDV